MTLQTSVLVVDDEPSIRKVIRTALTREGYDVTEAADGEEAYAACDAAGRVDVVVTDIVMPRTNGCELARRLKSDRPALPVIFITGQTVPPACETLHLPTIRKPFRMDALLTAIRTTLDQHR